MWRSSVATLFTATLFNEAMALKSYLKIVIVTDQGAIFTDALIDKAHISSSLLLTENRKFAGTAFAYLTLAHSDLVR